MTAAAIAITATVEAATITLSLFHLYLRAKRWAAAAEFSLKSAGFHRRRCGTKSAYSSIPVVFLRRIAS
jgi:hypothetical protein